MSMMASPRVLRWAVTLSLYDYKLEYLRGADNGNADFLSRLPLDRTVPAVPLPADSVLSLEVVNTSPVKVDQIREWTPRDPTLAHVYELLEHGWPDGVK